MIDHEKIRILALSSAAEDYTGLEELLGELERFPSASKVEKVVAASSVLGSLVEDGLVELFSGVWPPSHFEPVPKFRAAALIADPLSWELTSDNSAPYLAFASTDAGLEAYRNLPADAFEGLW